FSSTAAVLQLLAERGELTSRIGRVSLAVLLFQDLSVVPLLALLPLLAPGGGSGIAAALGLALLKGVAAILAILLIGRLVLRPLFRLSATTRIRETFAATNLLVVLGLGWATAQAGMSMALGAFLAGLLLAETEYRHQVEADILPVRGLFLGLFFITIGMLIDTHFVLIHWHVVLGLSIVLLAGKPAILWALARLFRLGAPLAVRAGLLLSQCGEFAFVILGIARGLGLIDDDLAHILIATVALTLATTPLMAMLGRRAGAALQSHRAPEAALMAEEAGDLTDHVIIAGFGRIGQIVGQMLAGQQLPYVAIEQSVPLVEESRRGGRPVYYGDASRAELLSAAGIERARAAIITIDQPDAAERVVAVLRHRHPDLHIIARSRDAAHARRRAPPHRHAGGGNRRRARRAAAGGAGMSKRPLSIAIIGAGLGGMAAALSLRHAGFEVEVYEQAARFGEIGAGIQIGPNASQLLQRIVPPGRLARDAVRPVAVHQRRWDDGRTLQRAPLGEEIEAAYGAPYYHFHRADLLAVLASEWPGERVHFRHRLAALDQVEGR